MLRIFYTQFYTLVSSTKVSDVSTSNTQVSLFHKVSLNSKFKLNFKIQVKFHKLLFSICTCQAFSAIVLGKLFEPCVTNISAKSEDVYSF